MKWLTPRPWPTRYTNPRMPALPARVRVSVLPLPVAPAVAEKLRVLLPGAPLETLTAGAVAVAGGKVIGAALGWQGGQEQALETGWRGRGIEEALEETLQAALHPA